MNRILFSSGSENWATPGILYRALNEEFDFTLDPCPIEGNYDGRSTLFMPWKGYRVFCNPPYGPGVDRWLQRAGEAELAVYLLPARTDTKWFHELVLPCAQEVRFLKGRLRFGESKNSAPFPSMIIVFSRDHARRETGQLSMIREAEKLAEGAR